MTIWLLFIYFHKKRHLLCGINKMHLTVLVWKKKLIKFFLIFLHECMRSYGKPLLACPCAHVTVTESTGSIWDQWSSLWLALQKRPIREPWERNPGSDWPHQQALVFSCQVEAERVTTQRDKKCAVEEKKDKQMQNQPAVVGAWVCVCREVRFH